MAVTQSSFDDLNRWQQIKAAFITTLAADQVQSELKTPPQGLSSTEAAIRLQTLGTSNVLVRPRWRRLGASLAILVRPLLIPLWIGAVIAFSIDRPYTGQALIAAAALNTIVAAIQERKAERTTAALHDALPSFARVLRDGQEQHILSTMLVPGDILLLRPNDIISADARVIESDHLHTVNAALHVDDSVAHKSAEAIFDYDVATGELPNVVYAGGRVTSGHGKAIVFATGLQSTYGQITALTLRAQEEPSPLLRAFARLGSLVLAIGTICAATGYWYTTEQLGFSTAQGLNVAVLFLTAAVPVGLMPGITLALIEGARRLQGQQAIFRRLSNVETLGATTVICADKTGTLTQNEMTVRELWTADGALLISGVGYQPRGEFSSDQKTFAPADVQQQAGSLLRAAVHTSTARLLPPDTLRPYWHILGDPIEAAHLVVAEKAGLRVADLYEHDPHVAVLANTQQTSLEGVIVQERDTYTLYVKGTPRDLLPLCSMIATANGERPINERDRQTFKKVQQRYQRDAMRIVVFARRTLGKQALHASAIKDVAHDLVLLGCTAVLDPPRQEVAAAIEACHAAHIRTIMLTSDDTIGATSIARRCTMVQSTRSRVISGPELETMDDATLREHLKIGDLVLARLTPQHKVRVVQALEALGEVVLVTGGEASDVPALKAAYTGIAMGATGSPAACQAADVILLDDNFATIASAIAEGRAVEQRVRRLVALNLATTVIKLVALIAALVAGVPLLLTVGQQLLIDFLAGLLPGLAIGAGRPDPRLMLRAPRPTGRPLLSRKMYTLGYGWFGGLASLIAAVAAFVYLGDRDEIGGTAAELLASNLQPYESRIGDVLGQQSLVATSLYVVISIAALLGAALIRRSAAPGDRRPQFVLVGLVGLSFTMLVGLIMIDAVHQYVALTMIPDWGWVAAIGATVLVAVCEIIRQRIDPIYKPSERVPVGPRLPNVPSANKS